MAEKVMDTPGFVREKGYLYYIGKEGGIWRAKMGKKKKEE